MPGRQDFYLTIERAAGLAVDAACEARGAGFAPLPAPHRRLLNRAVRSLESAQQDFFRLRNDPWSSQAPKPRQLELL